MRSLWFVVVLSCVACSKKSEEPPAGPSAPGSAASGSAPGSASGTSGSASGAATTPPSNNTGKAVLPTGTGPHEGFDLAAIHAKLQGTWLVGGSAFSSIPHVWSLDGDKLTVVDEKGTKSTTSFRLLAPCYYFEGTPGGSGSYGAFVLDGDTLYRGLGFAGVIQGNRTMACLAAGIYDHDGTACTLWRRKPFAKEGDAWTKEPGECGYTDDKSKFQGDDTKSSRKIYGVESVNVRGNVLLTQQMEGNKAEKVASFDEAVAKQKAAIDAKLALTKTPDNLPFKPWNIASTAPDLAAGATVWAAAVTRDGKWSLRTFRYKSFENDAVWLTGMTDVWAPSTWVIAPDTAKVVAGAPALLGIGALMPYGRVKSIEGDKAKVTFRSGNKIAEQTIELDRVLPIAPNQWTFGAPVAYKSSAGWEAGRLVHATDASAFVLIGEEVRELPRADVRLVDLGKKWSKGATVWAIPDSGISPLVFVQGKIDAVTDGQLFTITANGRKFDQTGNGILAKLP